MSSLFIKYLVMIVYLLLLAGCTGSKVDGITRLNNDAFSHKLHQGNYILLDVRTPQEYDSAHIPGAILMNIRDTATFHSALAALDKQKKYLVYCRTGKRSMDAARKMKAQGIKHICELEKGISGWTGPKVSSDNQ